jgi:hypothetical protein
MKPATQQQPVSTFGDVGTPSTFNQSKALESLNGLVWDLEAWLSATQAMVALKTPHRELPDIALAAQVCAYAERHAHQAAVRLCELSPSADPSAIRGVCWQIVDMATCVNVGLTFIDTCIEQTGVADKCDTLIFASRPLSAAKDVLEELRELNSALLAHVSTQCAAQSAEVSA